MNINLGLTADATGTVDVITATYSPAPTLVDKKILFLVSAGANTTTTPTFNPNSVGAQVIKARGNQTLLVGDTGAAGYTMILRYEATGTYWELLNPAAVADLVDVVAFSVKFGWSVLNPADANTYRPSPITTLAAGTADNINKQIRLPYAAKATYVLITVSGTGGSSEAVTVQVANITQATTYNFGTMDWSVMPNAVCFSGGTLTGNANDLWGVNIICPTWVTNPASIVISIEVGFNLN